MLMNCEVSGGDPEIHDQNFSLISERGIDYVSESEMSDGHLPGSQAPCPAVEQPCASGREIPVAFMLDDASSPAPVAEGSAGLPDRCRDVVEHFRHMRSNKREGRNKRERDEVDNQATVDRLCSILI
jgi:hypothetical protein